jgi:hypothetical protein
MHGQEGCKKTTNLEAVVTQVAVTLKLPSANWGVKGRFHTGGCLPIAGFATLRHSADLAG